MEIKGLGSVDVTALNENINKQNNMTTVNNIKIESTKVESTDTKKSDTKEENEKAKQKEATKEKEKSQLQLVESKYNRKFEFSVHEKTNRVMIKVINTDDDQVIKEIPAEKMLDMIASMCEFAGLFLDKKC